MALRHEEFWENSLDYGTCHEALSNPRKALTDSRTLLDNMFRDRTVVSIHHGTKNNPAVLDKINQPFERKNEERLLLLSRKYALESTKDFSREHHARLSIREQEVDLLNPRFTSLDGEFISKIEEQIRALTELQKI